MLQKPASCTGCALEFLGSGYMQSTGSGRNGVLLVGEALGAQEAEQGIPFVGAAGWTLDRMLQRGGMRRDDFVIANAVWCQPPGNKLSGMAYEDAAVAHCAPNLDRVIETVKPRCIVGLGAIATRRLLPDLGHLPITKTCGYTFWSARYQTWVVPTVHPSFVMRGQTAYEQLLIHNLQKAVDIARDGYRYDEPDYLLDPVPIDAMRWVRGFELYFKDHPDLYLSCDIETPEKDSDEDDLSLEDASDYTILRCSYSYKDLHAMSIPWGGPYQPIHTRLMGHPCNKLFWNAPFDVPRIRAAQ